MKPTPPPTLEGLTFDELVSRAKASETGLSPADLDRMVHRFEARLQAETGALSAQGGSAAPNAAGPNAFPPAARAGKLSAASKAIWSGVGLSAVAAFIYGTNVNAPAPTTPIAAVHAPQGAAASEPAFTSGDSLAPEGVVEPNEAAGEDEQASPNSEPKVANNRRAPAPRPRAAAAEPQKTLPQKTLPRTPPSQAGAITETAVEVPAAPATAPAAPSTPVKPALETSLAQLERAERELRTGNPSAALTALAQPVVPSLSSRADALRAVALCQSGQTAAGRRLGTQHLVRNPRSPYEQRLQRACGDL